MIEEQATVIALEGQHALLQIYRKSACHSCSVKAGCGTSVLSKVVGQRSRQIRVRNSLDARLGDTVLLGLEENALVHGSLLIYALPLVIMLLLAVVVEWWAKAQGYNAELLVILSAFLGFAISFVSVRFFINRAKFNTRLQPEMLRIMHHQVVTHDTMLAP